MKFLIFALIFVSSANARFEKIWETCRDESRNVGVCVQSDVCCEF